MKQKDKKLEKENYVVITRVFDEITPIEKRDILNYKTVRAIKYNLEQKKVQDLELMPDSLEKKLNDLDIICINGNTLRISMNYNDKEGISYFQGLIKKIKENYKTFAIAHPGSRHLLEEINEMFPPLKECLNATYSVSGGSGEEIAHQIRQILESKNYEIYQKNIKKFGDYIKEKSQVKI